MMTGSAKKRILFLTGTRADFGKLKPLIEVVSAAEEFDYEIFVTGMHMLGRYGHTYLEISKSGFDKQFHYFNQYETSGNQMDMVLASTIEGLGNYIREFPPNLLVIHGDRIETLAGAVVGALNNILVAHIEGGEVSGTVDELLRHSITKLSHIHFVANSQARARLLQMGEVPSSIFIIGSPDIDVMLSERLPTLEQVLQRYSVPFSDYAIFIYHPVTTEVAQLSTKIRSVVDGLLAAEMNFVVIHPNNDYGSEIIRNELRRLEGNPRFCLRPSMRFEYFLSLLRHARLIVGNSSAAIREAPAYGIPTINIGTRQTKRFQHASIKNVPEDTKQVLAALREPRQRTEPSLHFGSGNSAALFLEVLRRGELWTIAQQKQFRDLPGGGSEPPN